MTLRKSIRYGLVVVAVVLLFVLVADKAFFLYSRSRYISLSSRSGALRTSDMSRDGVRRLFGSPSIASVQEWVYRCQHVTGTRYGFPYCEILLAGSYDHLSVYEVWFQFDTAGAITKHGTRDCTGLIFESHPCGD